MARIEIGAALYDLAMAHLRSGAEAVGFFAATYEPVSRAFVLEDWQPITGDGYEYVGDFHVRLSDRTQTEVIKWATRKGASLVEVHSHGGLLPAAFSPTDLSGFEEWVPHCSWRLERRPYAAVVTADDGFDAIAWVESPRTAEQVDVLSVDGRDHRATGVTLSGGRKGWRK